MVIRFRCSCAVAFIQETKGHGPDPRSVTYTGQRRGTQSGRVEPSMCSVKLDILGVAIKSLKFDIPGL